jgi:hypothetical protein
MLHSNYYFIVLWKSYLPRSGSKLQAGTATLFRKSVISPSSLDTGGVHILNYNKGKKQLPRKHISRYYLAFYFKLRNCAKVTDGRILLLKVDAMNKNREIAGWKKYIPHLHEYFRRHSLFLEIIMQ